MDLLFGAGLTLKLIEERDVQGLMTAASIWMTARPAWPSGGAASAWRCSGFPRPVPALFRVGRRPAGLLRRVPLVQVDRV